VPIQKGKKKQGKGGNDTFVNLVEIRAARRFVQTVPWREEGFLGITGENFAVPNYAMEPHGEQAPFSAKPCPF